MNTKGRPFGPLADLVRQARQAKGLTQRQLSRALRMSEGYVGHLEGGRFRPTVQTLKALASVLGLLYGQLARRGGLHHPGRVRGPHRRQAASPTERNRRPDRRGVRLGEGLRSLRQEQATSRYRGLMSSVGLYPLPTPSMGSAICRPPPNPACLRMPASPCSNKSLSNGTPSSDAVCCEPSGPPSSQAANSSA